MKMKHALTTGLAATAIALSACKPTVDKTHNRVDALITAVQPGEDNISAAQDYYDSRADLNNITLAQRQSLIVGRAKLRRVQDGLQNGTISLEDFIGKIIGSEASIITDENTKLKVSHNVGRPVTSIHFGKNEWEIWTDDQSPNRILKNPKITSITLEGGSLAVQVHGDEYDLQSPDSKWDVLSRTEGSEVSTGEKTYTFDIGLVLEKKQVLADK